MVTEVSQKMLQLIIVYVCYTEAQILVRMFSNLEIGSVSDLWWNFRTIYKARNCLGIGLSYRPTRASTFKLLRGSWIDSKESIPPAYDSLAGLYDDLIPTRFLYPS